MRSEHLKLSGSAKSSCRRCSPPGACARADLMRSVIGRLCNWDAPLISGRREGPRFAFARDALIPEISATLRCRTTISLAAGGGGIAHPQLCACARFALLKIWAQSMRVSAKSMRVSARCSARLAAGGAAAGMAANESDGPLSGQPGGRRTVALHGRRRAAVDHHGDLQAAAGDEGFPIRSGAGGRLGRASPLLRTSLATRVCAHVGCSMASSTIAVSTSGATVRAAAALQRVIAHAPGYT
jgi:hypothetical protein